MRLGKKSMIKEVDVHEQVLRRKGCRMMKSGMIVSLKVDENLMRWVERFGSKGLSLNEQ